jgi:hypothetical protein
MNLDQSQAFLSSLFKLSLHGWQEYFYLFLFLETIPIRLFYFVLYP